MQPYDIKERQGQDSYKYLGIPQANDNHKEVTWKSSTIKYLQRVRQIL